MFHGSVMRQMAVTVVPVQVRLSVVEIYCERIRDLLDPSRDNLQVKQDGGGAIFIEGQLRSHTLLCCFLCLPFCLPGPGQVGT
jgi:hypothetical protein